MTVPTRADIVRQIEQTVPLVLAEAFVVEVQVHQGRGLRVEVLADTDAGIRLEQCSAINRGLREALEARPEGAWMADAELTVASPGVGSPLRLPRQFAANVGRTLALRLASGEEFAATLTAFAEPTLTLEWVARNPTTKKKELITRAISRADVARAVVQVTFGEPKPAAKPARKPATQAGTTSASVSSTV